MDTLDTLLNRAQDDDVAAYGEIVRRFQGMALGYAYATLGEMHLAEDVRQLEAGGADWLHFDVTDGVFVGNFGISTFEIAELRKETDLFLDVHLGIVEPDRHIELFKEAGADLLSVHVEACPQLLYSLEQVKSAGLKAGVALNPATPAATIEHVLGIVDVVLVMLVTPGYRGQKLFPPALAKARRIREMSDERGLVDLDIQVDGGIYPETLSDVACSGANVFVMGRTVFDAPDGITESLKRRRAEVERLRGI